MHPRNREATRRELLIASGTCAVASVVLPLHLAAQEKEAAPATSGPPAWLTAIRSVTGEAKVTEGKVVLDVPEIAENGNVIPFTASVESPMTAASFVRALRIYSTGNPLPLIATFRFSTDSGKAAVSSRFRLAKSQDVVALAEMSDGTFFMGKRSVKVTIGGCGG